jgi:hypothetical protein
MPGDVELVGWGRLLLGGGLQRRIHPSDTCDAGAQQPATREQDDHGCASAKT